jgi:hypothetical protein
MARSTVEFDRTLWFIYFAQLIQNSFRFIYDFAAQHHIGVAIVRPQVGESLQVKFARIRSIFARIGNRTIQFGAHPRIQTADNRSIAVIQFFFGMQRLAPAFESFGEVFEKHRKQFIKRVRLNSRLTQFPYLTGAARRAIFLSLRFKVSFSHTLMFKLTLAPPRFVSALLLLLAMCGLTSARAEDAPPPPVALTEILKDVRPYGWSDVRTRAAKAAENDAVRFPSNKVEDVTFEGGFEADATTRLAIFSDDGCAIYINDMTTPVFNRLGVGQHLPDLKQSLHRVNYRFEADRKYQIKVVYRNDPYRGTIDLDGLTLWIYKDYGVDLVVDDVTEKDEETKGSWVVLNENYEEDNGDAKGYLINDWQPRWNETTRKFEDYIVPSDEDLCSAFLKLDGPAGGRTKWKLEFPDKIKVWKKDVNSYSRLTSGMEYEDDVPSTLGLKIEGITKSAVDNDVTVKAFVMAPKESYDANDLVAMTVVQPVVTSQKYKLVDVPRGSLRQGAARVTNRAAKGVKPNAKAVVVPDEDDDADDSIEYVKEDTDFKALMSGGSVYSDGRQTTSNNVAASNQRSSRMSGADETSSTRGAARTAVAGVPSATPTISGLHPLIRYSRSGQIISANNLRGSIGDAVTWRIVRGPAQLSIHSNSGWGASAMQPLHSGGVSPVYFKPTGTGLVQVNVYNAKNRRVIQEYTTIYQIQEMHESDHAANRVPNEKWRSVNAGKFKNAGINRSILKRTLWFAEEPENGKA